MRAQAALLVFAVFAVCARAVTVTDTEYSDPSCQTFKSTETVAGGTCTQNDDGSSFTVDCFAGPTGTVVTQTDCTDASCNVGCVTQPALNEGDCYRYDDGSGSFVATCNFAARAVRPWNATKLLHRSSKKHARGQTVTDTEYSDPSCQTFKSTETVAAGTCTQNDDGSSFTVSCFAGPTGTVVTQTECTDASCSVGCVEQPALNEGDCYRYNDGSGSFVATCNFAARAVRPWNATKLLHRSPKKH